MLITPDLTEATEMTTEPIPPGVYRTRIEDAELKDTKAGAKRLVWKLKIYGADGELAKYNNWPVFHSTMLSGPGAGMLKTFYKAALKKDLEGSFDATELFGKEVEVVLTEGKNQDGTPSSWPNIKAVKALN